MVSRDAGSLWVTLASWGFVAVVIAIVIHGFAIWAAILGLAFVGILRLREFRAGSSMKDERRATL